MVETRKEGKRLAEEFRVLRPRLDYLYDEPGSDYKGDGEYGIDAENDQGTRVRPEDQLHPIPHS